MLVWIVGAGGLLGRALSTACTEAGIDFHPSPKEEADITSLEDVQCLAEALRPTHIINCAAYTDVDRAEADAERAFLVNATGAENLAKVASDLGAKFVHVSTDYVFDGEGKTLYTETAECHPINVYGQSKREGEVRVQKVYPGACVVRTSWLFGEGGNNFFSSLLGWLQTKESLHIVSDQINRPTYVEDLAIALLELRDEEGIFHFANAHPMSRFEMAQDFWNLAIRKGLSTVCREVLPACAADFPAPAPRPHCTALSTEKYCRVLGKEPRSWDAILHDYMEVLCESQSVC